jgi:hypothetical protein
MTRMPSLCTNITPRRPSFSSIGAAQLGQAGALLRLEHMFIVLHVPRSRAKCTFSMYLFTHQLLPDLAHFDVRVTEFTMLLCRTVFGQSMPIHLCTYHVVTAWYKAICQRVKKDPSEKPKVLIKRIFKGIHDVMKHRGTNDLEGSKAAARVAFSSWCATWGESQPEVVAYFKSEWGSKIGAISRSPLKP